MFLQENIAILISSNILTLILIYVLLNKTKHFPYKVRENTYIFSLLLVFVFCIFAFWGSDWYHYRNIYNDIRNNVYNGHLEDIYIWIANFLSFNYISFRIIIWGISLILLLQIIKELNVNKYLALFIFSSIWLIWFSYARVSLSMSLLFYGLTMIINKKKTYIRPILGIILILLSAFTHRSCLIIAAISFFVFISMNVNSKQFGIITIFGIPIILFIFSSIISRFMNIDIDNDGLLGNFINAGQYYITHDRAIRGSGDILQKILERIPYWIIAYQGFTIQYKNIYKEFPKKIKFFIRMQYCIVIFSSILIIPNFGFTDVIGIRMMRFALIPSIIVLTYFWEKNYDRKLTRISFLSGILSQYYAIFYSLYCNI